MGNSHSSTSTNDPKPERHRPLNRHRSAIFSRLSLGCATGNASFISASTRPSQDSSIAKEKASLGESIVEPKRIVLPMSTVAYAPTNQILPEDATLAYNGFLRDYPEYKLTWILDTLRRTDYARLERTGETYVDYMGGALYPESLIRVHTDFLNDNVLGNTHSVSNSSRLSLKCADEARAAVLSYFKAPPEYTVVFTANASSALKLVGESYPFTGGSAFVLGADSHNSVHGLREYATHRGARICYIESTRTGGFDTSAAKDILLRNRPRSRDLAPSLFALTAQSNITNTKNPLSIIDYATSLGYHTLLDAAALAPTSTFSLTDCPVDAMAISFYKMFGFPTGVGALVVRKDFLAQLQRPWFAGGTVSVVQVPGTIFTRAQEIHERFEDGTINYLTLPAITDGLRFLSAYLPFLPLRLSSLLHYLIVSLSALRHDTTGGPVVRILSRVPARKLKSIGDKADTGSLVSLVFLEPTGEMMPNSFIEWAATKQQISLRTGCMCNPGGAASLLNIEEDMRNLYPGVTLCEFERRLGRELGVIRISLGLASNFEDVWKVIRFAASIGNHRTRQGLLDRWPEATGRNSFAIGEAL
ncbi:PLP-dependent transferase [Pluteus cervinus]|uniref:PLP-dependent transferase n=1 Tax=Pluteus cervinus TaxID=181527 RepID=A0ACD3AJ72_9AGAR|nr:PLP-dependent transferase [Pluteus cervinus]